jgi:hypothetical protein
MHPEITKQLADEHRRDMLADAQNRRLVRQFDGDRGTARHRQPLTYRLWRRLRPVARPRLEPQL